ncbi:Hypothetical predicted protein [Paramuricea clavata]|uniref:Uncharacterized protein n=1 Tax=Paramuricea clavata TaxID=317549 RepID=A0A6S7GPL0_PARCT|nr:Hypothetical predicted protein [Paramuricea clavata]
MVVSTYETFLRYVNERFETGNPDYIGVSQRLKGLSPNKLLELGAQWHRNCYCETTEKNKLERDKKRYQMNSENNLKGKGRPSSGSVSCRLTRSGSDPETARDAIHSCQSKNSANSIKDIVDKNDNAKWKVQFADILAKDDFLARDIVYHKSCKTKYWRKHVQASDRQSSCTDANKSTLFIAAEIEFFDHLNEIVESGEYITTVEVETLYKNIMHDHGIDKPITRRSLISNISQNMPHIVISQHRGSLPGVLHSKKAGHEAVDIARTEKYIKGDLDKIFKSAKVIRWLVINTRKECPWAFTGHLDGSSESGVPRGTDDDD